MPEDATSPTLAPREYWCFLSYRHADNQQPGRQWASWLHHSLETYEVPADLVGKKNERGDTIPERIFPVFRDEDELSADAKLSKPIEQALANSRFLVVLCSPAAVESAFVADEIVFFKKFRPENQERLLATIIAGDPTSADPAAPYDRRPCFPRPLRFEVAPDGTITSTPTEPIAADFRLPDGTEGFTSPMAYRAHLGKSARSATIAEFDRRLELMKLKIIAGILGLPVGVLTMRDQAYQLEKERARARTLRRWLSAVAVLTVLALLAGVFAWYQRGVAQTSEAKARANEQRALDELKEASRSDVASAQARLGEGKWQEAVAYLGRAIRYDPDNRNAQDALWLALRYGQRDAGAMPMFVFHHDDAVLAAAFSPDGTHLVTAGRDNTARLWDLSTGRQVGAPLRHEGPVNTVCFSPDGSRILTASNDHTARLWDAKTGASLGPILHHEASVTSASFSPDGSRIVTASNDNTARIWDARTGTAIGAPLRHDEAVTAASFNFDGSRIVTASVDKSARLWDATTGAPIGPALTHEDVVNDARFSPDGSRVLTASADHTAQLWDARTGQRLGPPLQHKFVVFTATFSPDGTRVVTASNDNTARLWDAQTGQPIGPPLLHHFGVVCATFSPDGSRVLTASSDNTAHLWNAMNGAPLGSPLEHTDSVVSATFSPDGAWIVTTSQDHTAALWDTRMTPPAGLPFPHVKPAETPGKETEPDDSSTEEDLTGVTAANFGMEGRAIVTAGFDHTARIWSVSTSEFIPFPFRHLSTITVANFAPDKPYHLVTASVDGSVRVWLFGRHSDLAPSIPRPALQFDGAVNSARFDPVKDRVLAASDDGTARLWYFDSDPARAVRLPHAGKVLDARFSPDGTMVVTASADHTARLWNASDGAPFGAPLQHVGPVRTAVFSPDGYHVLTASSDNTARLWDAKTCQPLGPPMPHGAPVVAASFSPDGTRIVTASNDQTARLWDAKTCQPIGPPMYHGGEVLSACFSADGARVLTSSGDHTARLWDATTAQPLGPPLWHGDWAVGACFSPDDSQLLSASRDYTARLWDLRTGPFLPPTAAEPLAAFFSGTQLDPKVGNLQPIPFEQRHQLWENLQSSLAPYPEWRSIAAQLIQHDPLTTFVSPRATLTIRQASTRLLSTLDEDLPAEVLAIDPTNPLLPFALATLEASNAEDHPNPTRATWLIAYGLRHLPPNTSAPDLRLAATYIARVSKTLPAQKSAALTLLDRAAKLDPNGEDEATKSLRATLQR